MFIGHNDIHLIAFQNNLDDGKDSNVHCTIFLQHRNFLS